MEFQGFPKIARLSRECVVTEKIDGTNAQIKIVPYGAENDFVGACYSDNDFIIYAGSRNRWVDLKDDNYGFAKWVATNAEELLKLGPGQHFGEWWGAGIQRRYGLTEKRFSLFNVGVWNEENKPACCHVVPVLYRGEFDTQAIAQTIDALSSFGSVAAPGFMDPEGVIVYHEAAKLMFKKTCKDDEKPKGQANG